MAQNTAALNAALNGPIIQNPVTGRIEFAPHFVRFLNSLVNDRRINTGAAQPVTIASGVISLVPGFSYYKVTVQSGATDDLDTINGGNEGDLIFLKAASDTADVVLRDGTGNIITEGGVNLTLDDLDDLALLHFDGTAWKAAIWNIS